MSPENEDYIFIDMSDEAAQSESRDLEPIPAGKYLVICSNADLVPVKNGVNAGSPMMNLEFTVEDDLRGLETYIGRKIFTNIMLFGEKNYSASWIMKAMELPVTSGKVGFPGPSRMMGTRFAVRVTYIGEQKDKHDPSKVYAPKNGIGGYWNESQWLKWKEAASKRPAADVTGQKRSLLP